MALKSFDDGLFRGPTPSLDELLDNRIATVVNLQASHLEVLYESTRLRMYGIQEFVFMACPLFPPSLKTSLRALTVLREKTLQPTLVHCLHGEDRTGFVVALYRIVEQGWSEARAIAEMKREGFHSWCFFWWVPELRRQARILKRRIHRLM